MNILLSVIIGLEAQEMEYKVHFNFLVAASLIALIHVHHCSKQVRCIDNSQDSACKSAGQVFRDVLSVRRIAMMAECGPRGACDGNSGCHTVVVERSLSSAVFV